MILVDWQLLQDLAGGLSLTYTFNHVTRFLPLPFRNDEEHQVYYKYQGYGAVPDCSIKW